ncbi:hypothetical protein [Kineococcus sp. SYSU DK006]|uniref:hypothetical protein n=1 Tax=Kineococcus sp. SYSU DK006 TaxID=3383127 RepID=UPI003D7D917D
MVQRSRSKAPASALQGALSIMIFLEVAAVTGVVLGHVLHSYLLGAAPAVLIAAAVTGTCAWVRRRQ